METTSSAEAPGALARVRGFLSGGARWQRELILFAVMTLFGLFAMPFIIYFASPRVLGPYTYGQNLHAGPLVLLGDYLSGLVHGSLVYWVVALGPAVILLLLRLFVLLWRSLP
jgi:hypothetical protein